MAKTQTPRVNSKVARHQLIARLLEHHQVTSQSALLELLVENGLTVTQATLSRDLDELGAVRVATSGKKSVYELPQDSATAAAGGPASSARLARVVAELLSSADHAGNIVVLRTPPGAAQYLASAIDHGTDTDIIGTVAGDDTVFMVAKDQKGARLAAARFTAMASRRGTQSRTSSGNESEKEAQ